MTLRRKRDALEEAIGAVREAQDVLRNTGQAPLADELEAWIAVARQEERDLARMAPGEAVDAWCETARERERGDWPREAA